ncbi:MAG: glycosyltransferase family 39 protein [Anaerolineae bacterium]|nr:glycosyltransferase family 39 protein [Anaerolineae bacterium]
MTVPELIALAVAFTYTYPWAMLVLPPPRAPVELALTTMALSIGGLTLGMLALALVAPDMFSLTAIGGLMVLTFGVGAWVWLEARVIRPGRPTVRRVAAQARRALVASPLMAGAVLIPVAIGALILFNAGYWPFGDWDALTIYAPQGKHLYEQGTLPAGEGLYEAYPMLVPFSYAFAHFVADSVNEYLARLAPAALAVGAMAAAYALGRAMHTARAGVVAALLLALTPTYTRWASSGYVDLPAAFFFTLSALFCWRLYQTGRARHAALAGVMAGLAAWTKNGALALAVSLPLWFLYTHLRARLWPALKGGRPVAPRHGALALGALALVAGPWYARNLLLFGVIVPPTGWTAQAAPTLGNLVPFLAHPGDYFVPGLVYTAGIGAALWWAARKRASAALALIFTAPLFAVWWALFSYETRFLLMVLPLAAVMGGRAVDAALNAVASSKTPWALRIRRALGRTWARWAALALLLALALPAAFKAVEHKDDILRNPLMDDAAKHRVRTGPAFAVGGYLDTLPRGARVLSSVRFAGYYTSSFNDVLEVDDVAAFAAAEPAHADRYDYWVFAPGTRPTRRRATS